MEDRLKQRKIPKQIRAETTVASITEAAARILEQEGLEGYNTNAIARLAGISVGSLYQYFPHKDAITCALREREASNLLTILEQIAENNRGLAAVRGIVAAIVTHLMRRPNLARILDMLEQQLSLQDQMLKGETRVQELIAACMADGKHAMPSEQSLIIADMIGIVRGMVDGAAARGERDIGKIIDRVCRAVEGYWVQSQQHMG